MVKAIARSRICGRKNHHSAPSQNRLWHARSDGREREAQAPRRRARATATACVKARLKRPAQARGRRRWRAAERAYALKALAPCRGVAGYQLGMLPRQRAGANVVDQGEHEPQSDDNRPLVPRPESRIELCRLWKRLVVRKPHVVQRREHTAGVDSERTVEPRHGRRALSLREQQPLRFPVPIRIRYFR